jgi:hypothetical protein
MKLRVPVILENSKVKCDVRGFSLKVGDFVKTGDFIAELRYEVIEDSYSDCPLVYYGDLIAAASGSVITVETNSTGGAGMVLGEIGDGEGDFPVTFETL